MFRTLIILASVVFLLTGCKGGDDDDSAAPQPEQYPDIFCPGDYSGMCDEGGDQVLSAGAARIKITPTCWETWNDANENGTYGLSQGDSFNDCGCDRLCPGDEGYPGADEGEDDGEFQVVWLAGGDNARAMNEFHDDLWLRAVYFQQGNTSLAMVSADLFGYPRRLVKNAEEEIRQDTELDYLLVSSTHTHEAGDTVGMYGPGIATTGVVDSYMDSVHAALVQVVTEAAAAKVPVDLEAVQYDIKPTDCEGQGVNNFNFDHRDPNIVDERIFTIRAVEAGTDNTVATLMNWPNHPEVMIDEWHLTSGFAHYWRNGVEDGVETPDGTVPGVGGTAIYFQGMLGGMMTPLGTNPYDLFGTQHTEYGFEMIEAQGNYLAYFSLTSLGDAQPISDPALSFRFKEIRIPVENIGFWIYINAGVLPKDHWFFEAPNEEDPITEDNPADVLTEVGIIEIGPIQILTIPGEMLPEFVLGGYDGSHTGPLEEIIDEENNPPDLSQAPEGPYFIDKMTGEYKMTICLSNDFLGYIIPDWEYELGVPEYLDEADGDHYEETNSLGPSEAAIIDEAMNALLEWQFP